MPISDHVSDFALLFSLNFEVIPCHSFEQTWHISPNTYGINCKLHITEQWRLGIVEWFTRIVSFRLPKIRVHYFNHLTVLQLFHHLPPSWWSHFAFLMSLPVALGMKMVVRTPIRSKTKESRVWEFRELIPQQGYRGSVREKLHDIKWPLHLNILPELQI